MSRGQSYARFGRQAFNFAQQNFGKGAANAANQSSKRAASGGHSNFANAFKNANSGSTHSGNFANMFRQTESFAAKMNQQNMRAARQQFEKVASTLPALMNRCLSTSSASGAATTDGEGDGVLTGSGDGSGALSVNDSKGTKGVKKPRRVRLGG